MPAFATHSQPLCHPSESDVSHEPSRGPIRDGRTGVLGASGTSRTRLTVSRLGAGGLRVCFIEYELYFWALALFVIAAITDALDGYFARLLKQDTPDRPPARPLDRQGDRFGLLYLPRHDSGHRSHALDGHGHRGPRALDSRFAQPSGRPGSSVRGRMAGKLKTVVQCRVDLGRASLSGARAAPPVGLLWIRDILTWLAVALTLYSGFSYVWIAFPKLRGEKHELLQLFKAATSSLRGHGAL